MNFLYMLMLRLRLWDHSFAIQMCNTRINQLRKEIAEREAAEAELVAELFHLQHGTRRA